MAEDTGTDRSRFRSKTSGQLLAEFAALLDELQQRKLVRSANNPVADYAEVLAAKALGLTLGNRSTKGYDARDSDGRKYEVKARRLRLSNGSRQLSVIRDLDGQHFDLLVGVLLNSDFSVFRAAVMPHGIVKVNSSYRPHVNGWIVHLTDSLWDVPGVTDITEQIRAAADALSRTG